MLFQANHYVISVSKMQSTSLAMLCFICDTCCVITLLKVSKELKSVSCKPQTLLLDEDVSVSMQQNVKPQLFLSH